MGGAVLGVGAFLSGVRGGFRLRVCRSRDFHSLTSSSASAGGAGGLIMMRVLGGWCGEIDGHVHYIARIVSHAASLRQPEAIGGGQKTALSSLRTSRHE